MKTFFIETSHKDEINDITDTIEEILQQNTIKNGACLIFVKHTTCCITTADLDPGTDIDFLEFLRKIIPEMRFRHPHDPSHAPDHILSSIIGTSLTVPIVNGQLDLGVWQRVVLVELDGPRKRELSCMFIPEQ
ncbi:MAG TPA: secondary thiamine-phosphate synthase enzyme YjbQ [Patescibacteria group bacterium]